MKNNGVHMFVRVDGDMLEDYALENLCDGTATFCVASEAGKTFSILLRNRCGISYQFRCYVDGIHVSRRLLLPGRSAEVRGVDSDDHTSYRPFKFCQLQLTDDENSLCLANVEELGTFRVDLFRVQIVTGYANHGGNGIAPPPPIIDHAPVHETTKKAGAHVTTLGDAVTYNEPPRQAAGAGKWRRRRRVWHMPFSYERVDSLDEPYLRFVCHYRPKDLLQAQDIIPTEPSCGRGLRKRSASPPTAGPSKRSCLEGHAFFDSLDVGKEANIQVKKENDDDDGHY